MISRRKIISRSLDNLDAIGPNMDEEEDVWYDKDKLFRDHINEVLNKWEQIDDEIWAKIIVFEKNRRVAKAYARSSMITINGSKNGFDGIRIGLNGFENPMRDSETKTAKKSIGEGFKIKMDDVGNIFIKRYGKSNVYVHSTAMANEETVIGADIIQLPNMALTPSTSYRLFDMRKYTVNMNREFGRPYPESNRLERQCLSAVSLVNTNNNLLNSPVWIMVINVVAVDMLMNRLQSLPKSIDVMGARANNNTNTSGSEDPYSTIESQVGLIYPTPAASDDSTNSSNSNGSSKSRRSLYQGGFLDESPYMPRPDYEIYNESTVVPMPNSKKNKTAQRKKQDDPYYCGLLARIPNFIKSSKSSKPKKEPKISRKISASQQVLIQHQSNQQQPQQHHHHQQQQQLPQQQHQQQFQQKRRDSLADPNQMILPIATFHQYTTTPTHPYYPYKMYTPNHRLSQSQLSLWDARSLISAHE